MKIRLEKEAVQLWLAQRTPREAVLVFLAGFALIYLLWNLIVELPLRHSREALLNQSQDTSRLLDTQKQNLNAIEVIISSSSFTRNITRQKQLSSQFRRAGQQLQGLQQTFVPVEALSRVTNDVIAQQEEVLLVSMKTFSGEPWLKSTAAKKNLSNLQDIYQHKMELEFRGSYFNTIAFLAHLEKLPWHLYWDQLDYQVLEYPEAKVVARFYVLSNEKG